MQPHKLSVFDVAYDGFTNLAKHIVQIYEQSNDFKLSEYPGQDDFYEEYLSMYTAFSQNIISLQPSDNYLLYIDLIYRALIHLADQRSLHMAHFCYAYVQLLDIYNQILNHGENESVRELRVKDPFINPSVDNILQSMELYKNQIYGPNRVYKIPMSRIVPFTSPRGLFGFNTFFYLFFNHLYPVAISFNDSPIHGGILKHPIHIALHDYQHLANIYPYTTANFEQLKNLYMQIMDADTHDSQKKAYLLTLFYIIHEDYDLFNCSMYNQMVPISYNDLDLVDEFIKLQGYQPLDFGLQYPQSQAEQAKYLELAIQKGLRNICSQFKEHIPVYN